MTEKKYVALLDELDAAVAGLDALRELGLPEDAMEVMSGVPFHEPMLGREHVQTHVPQFAMGGALLGFGASVALNFGTVALYPLRVGGFPLFNVAPTWILTFELTMLGMLLATFLGVIIELIFFLFTPKDYHPAVSDGKIGLFYRCTDEVAGKAQAALEALGAAVTEVEAKVL